MSDNSCNCQKNGEYEYRLAKNEEEIRELKNEVKENSKFYSETLIFLRETLARVTVIMEQNEKRLESLDKKNDNIEEKLDALEIAVIQKNSPETKTDEDKKMYRKIITVGFIALIIIILFLLGMSPTDISNIIKVLIPFGG